MEQLNENKKIEESIKTNKLIEYDTSWLKGTSAEISLNSNKNKLKLKPDYSKTVYKKLSSINGKINDMSNDDLIKELENLKLDYIKKE